MGKRSERLKIVLDLAHRKEAETLETLAKAQKELNGEQLRLRQLESYMGDYQDKIRGKGGAGISAVEYANFQGFMYQLGVALEQQQKKLLFLTQQVDVCTRNWRVAHEKTKGMEEHIAACRRSEEKELAKQEQRMLDEFSQLRNNYRPD
ncbi:MAG: flagellar export protein FliJ [Gammaproteobacteria bacterium]|nr:MAG: flagellar export protein FliJ [Pseudomonadota bacterium]PIE38110.1 MAG: flagellar export protein FliJ [Gammaproteobacteria bacterium]